jgi:hypothetical protein
MGPLLLKTACISISSRAWPTVVSFFLHILEDISGSGPPRATRPTLSYGMYFGLERRNPGVRLDLGQLGVTVGVKTLTLFGHFEL